MPSAKCKCGYVTNSAVSNYATVKPFGEPTECYARMVEGKWQRGCAYDRASEFMKEFVNDLVEGK